MVTRREGTMRLLEQGVDPAELPRVNREFGGWQDGLEETPRPDLTAAYMDYLVHTVLG